MTQPVGANFHVLWLGDQPGGVVVGQVVIAEWVFQPLRTGGRLTNGAGSWVH